MTKEDDDLFHLTGGAKARFGDDREAKKVATQARQVIEAMDVADLIGAGARPSASTGFDFGPMKTAAAEQAAPLPQPPAAPPAAAGPPAAPRAAAPPAAAPRPAKQPGFFARLLAFFRRG